MKITKTNVLDYMVPAKTMNADKDIVLLVANENKNLFTIGTDDNLYVYAEQQENKTRFTKRLISEECTQFAAHRIGKSRRFALAYIKNSKVFAAVTDAPSAVVEEEFKEMNFDSICQEGNFTPTELFMYSQGENVTVSVLVKTSRGTLEQYVASFSEIGVTSAKYSVLNANFEEIKNNVVGRAVKQPVDGVYTLGKYVG